MRGLVSVCAQNLLQSDLMVFSLLTITTFGLVSMSTLGLQYFMLQGNRAGFSRSWTRGSLIVFLIIIVSVPHTCAHLRTCVCSRVHFRQRDNYYGTECAFRCANCACMRVMGAINCDRNAADARHSESNCIPCFIRFILLRQLVAYTVNVFMIIRALVRPWYK